jgi:nitrile hydratase accessory protein
MRPDRPPWVEGRRAVERLVRDLPSSDAIPRREDELSFREPWEVRTLGLVVGLHEAGHFEWPEFQAALAKTIAEWERMPEGERRPWSYYACWQQAAERLVTGKQFLTTDEFDERAEEFVSGRRTPPHTHGGGLLSRDTGTGPDAPPPPPPHPRIAHGHQHGGHQ